MSRTRPYRGTHSEHTIALCIGALGVAGIILLGFTHWAAEQERRAQHAAEVAMAAEARQVAADRAARATLEQRQREQLAAEQARQAAARTFADRYEPQPVSRITVVPSGNDAEETLRIIEETRRLRRELDEQEYSRRGPPPTIVGSSAYHEAPICSALRSQREQIEAQMRQGFRNGQYQRDRLTDIWSEMRSQHCDMSRP